VAIGYWLLAVGCWLLAIRGLAKFSDGSIYLICSHPRQKKVYVFKIEAPKIKINQSICF
jgi:hypothetical protein